MGFPRQEHWGGLPFPSPGDLPDPGIEPSSPASAGEFFTTEPPESQALITVSKCLVALASFFPGTTGRSGEEKGNPLQYSCLENPRDRGAWWTAIYGVAQSQTWLKRLSSSIFFIGLPRWCSGKESACQCKRHRRWGLGPWVGKIPWRRKWQPTPVFLPRESRGQRSLTI